MDDETEKETPRFYKLELQVERFRIQLERIVADIESEKRTRSEANNEIRATIDRMADRFNAAIKEVADNYKGALRELAVEFRESHKALSQHSRDAEAKTQSHLQAQDRFQYKLMGGLIAAQIILAFLAPWLYKIFRID